MEYGKRDRRVFSIQKGEGNIERENGVETWKYEFRSMENGTHSMHNLLSTPDSVFCFSCYAFPSPFSLLMPLLLKGSGADVGQGGGVGAGGLAGLDVGDV